jgi:hypothetical protein
VNGPGANLIWWSSARFFIIQDQRVPRLATPRILGLEAVRSGKCLSLADGKGENMENSGGLFEGDVVAPEQFLEIFSRGRALEPEKELMLAILADAIECILKYCEQPIPMRIKLFQEAREWLFDHEEKEPFSFLNVCETLDLDPSYLRRGIQEKMRSNAVEVEMPARRSIRMSRLNGVSRIAVKAGKSPERRRAHGF